MITADLLFFPLCIVADFRLTGLMRRSAPRHYARKLTWLLAFLFHPQRCSRGFVSSSLVRTKVRGRRPRKRPCQIFYRSAAKTINAGQAKWKNCELGSGLKRSLKAVACWSVAHRRLTVSLRQE